MKVTFHRKEQDDLRGTPILVCHVRSSDGNRSTRAFAIMHSPSYGIMILAGGRHIRELLEDELDGLARAIEGA